MGLGAFAARKQEWLGFHPLMKGFGGEEGYLHKKYLLAGGKAVSLPAFKWVHRFARPRGVPYSNTLQDRITNYFIGALDLGEPPDRIIEYFSPRLSEWELQIIYRRAITAMDSYRSQERTAAVSKPNLR